MAALSLMIKNYGPVAQLGERQLCKLDVASSNLVRSTIFYAEERNGLLIGLITRRHQVRLLFSATNFILEFSRTACTLPIVGNVTFDGDLKDLFYLGQCHMGGNLVWSQDYRPSSNLGFQTIFIRSHYEKVYSCQSACYSCQQKEWHQ
jgi:hypothetical protein